MPRNELFRQYLSMPKREENADMPKISIVLPVYNGEKYLKQSVDSILAQSYTDWELILVDDCSTDGTSDIVDQYAEADSRIIAIHNETNQRLPRSLNIGFSMAEGQYLTWTSDDNLYMSNALEVMAGYLDSHEDIYMVRGAMDIIDEQGEIIAQSKEYDDAKLYTYNCVGACFMYRREVRDVVGEYDDTTFCAEDYDYWLRVLAKFRTIASINEILYQYRRHESSLSGQKKKEINNQTTKLRLRNLDRMFCVLQGNKAELCRIYHEMIRSEYMTQEVADRFKGEVPELCAEVPYTQDKKYIIFGAGNYGERAAKQLGDQAVCFVDNDPNKAGKVKCGLKIMFFQDAVLLAEDYCFMIAVYQDKIYDMMAQLQRAGIQEYAVFMPEL